MSSVSPMGVSSGLILTPTSARQHARQLAFVRRQRRRRSIFISLLGFAAVTGLGALGAGGGWVELHLAADGIVLGYVAWLIENRNRRAERVHKVHRLRPATSPTFLDDYRAETGT